MQCYLGQWLCWDSHAETRAQPRPRLYWDFERRCIQNIVNLPMFLRKIMTTKTTEELTEFIDFAGSVHWGDFLCVTVHISAHQLHTTPRSSHVIICEMTFFSSSSFYFILFFILFLLFTNILFQFLLHRPIFFLILLERKFLPVGDVFNSFSCSGFVIGEDFYSFLWNCTLYTEINISAHWLN